MPSAQAQGSARFQLDPLQAASPYSPFFTVDAVRPSPGPFSASVLTDYAREPLTVRTRDGSGALQSQKLVRDALLTQPVFGASLGNRWLFDLSLPVALLQSGKSSANDPGLLGSPRGGVPGDVRLGVLYNLWPTVHGSGTLGLRAWAPTGTTEAYMSDDRFRAEIVGAVFQQQGPWNLGCSGHLSASIVSPRAGDRAALGCAVDAALGEHGPRLGLESVAAFRSIEEHQSMRSSLEAWATVRQSWGPVHLGLGAGPGLGDAPGTPSYRVLGQVSFVPSVSASPQQAPAPALDADQDGVLDAQDACPHDAGVHSQDPLHNGCPRLDSDGDGIEDVLDNCPRDKGARSADPAANGCPDADNDHIVDVADRCPLEPGSVSKDPALMGCPVHARLLDERFVLLPALPIVPSPSTAAVEEATLREVAFTLRAIPALSKVSVEVKLRGRSGDLHLADRALRRASALVKRLVDLGIDPERLEAVGSATSGASVIDIAVVERQGQTPK